MVGLAEVPWRVQEALKQRHPAWRRPPSAGLRILHPSNLTSHRRFACDNSDIAGMDTVLARWILAGVAVVGALVVGGCGDDDDGTRAQPQGPLAEALANVGGAGEGSLGIGWADPQLVKQSGLRRDVIATALGPNAGSFVNEAAALRHRFGLDPLAADQLVSMGGSYAFGMRLDGVDGRGLARALVADGGRVRRVDGLQVIEIGDYAVVPEALLSLGIRGLGAFDALGRELAVLAISDRARSALLGRGGALLDEPIYRAASACLGDVVAARMIPDKLLLSSEVGIEQAAMGVTTDGEVLCVLGGTPERADQVAGALENTLAPDARDPVSGEPIGASLVDVDVSQSSYDGVEVVRAEGRVAGRAQPGFFFGTIARGSLVSLINGDAETFLP